MLDTHKPEYAVDQPDPAALQQRITHLEQALALRDQELAALRAEVERLRTSQSGRTAEQPVDQALSQAQERFRVAAQLSSDSIYELDLASGQVRIFKADSYPDDLRQILDEITDTWWRQVLHPDDRERVLHARDQLIAENKPFAEEYRIVLDRQPTLYLYDRAVVLRNNQGEAMSLLGVTTDITRHKQVEATLRESEERYTRAVTAGRVGIWDWNLETNEIYLAPNLKAMLGYEDHEIRNHLDDWGNYVYPDDRELVMKAAEACLRGETPSYEVEHRMQHKDGSVRWFIARGIVIHDAAGKPIWLCGTDTDITERKRAESDLSHALVVNRIVVEFAEGELQRRDAILQSISVAATHLLQLPDLEQAMPNALQALGMAAGVSRVYVFENSQTPEGMWQMSQRFEWCEPGIVAQIANKTLQHLRYQEGGFARWEEVLSSEEPIYGDVAAFPSAEQAILAPQNILSIVVVPIFVGQQWWGFLGFDECREARIWSLLEIEALKATAGIIGAALQRAQTETALREHQILLQSILDHVPVSIHARNLDGCYILANKHAASALELAPDQMVGKPVRQIVPATLVDWFQAIDKHIKATGELYFEEIVKPATPERDIQAHIVCSFPLYHDDGHIFGIGTIATDITERKRAELYLQHTNTQLHEQVIRDPLTDLYNRRYLDEKLPYELQRAAHHQQSVGVMMVDIDYFKRFNDTYGHSAGDTMLRGVGALLQAHTRDQDISCRYGGEEFTLVLPGAGLEESRQRAEEVRTGIKALVVQHLDQSLETVTVSVGVAVFPKHGTTADAIIKAADDALYQAKQAGRDRVVVATHLPQTPPHS